MTSPRVLIVDRDAYAATVLADELQRCGIAGARHAEPDVDLPAALARFGPDAVLLNYHFEHPVDLLACCAARAAAPTAGIGVIAAAGAPGKAVRHWAEATGMVDAVIGKPLVEDSLPAEVRRLAAREAAHRSLDARRIASLLPDGALAALAQSAGTDGDVFDAAVLFTDIRRSSDLAVRNDPREFFAILNRSLSAQAAQVRTLGGAVVKYTGDGLMAVFRGPQRACMALQCALALAVGAEQADMPFGIGVAQGEVLAGLVGDSAEAGARRQYDVIGATVHLAARLCDMASAGEVITTREVYADATPHEGKPVFASTVPVRGFETPVDCVALCGNRNGA